MERPILRSAKKVFTDLLPLSEFYAKTGIGNPVMDTRIAPRWKKDLNNSTLWYKLLAPDQRAQLRTLLFVAETLGWVVGGTAVLTGEVAASIIALAGFNIFKAGVMGFARYLQRDLR